MTALARLRHTATGLLGRLVLSWFALTLGAAMAAPAAHPAALQAVCTSAGSVAPQLPADGGAPGGVHLDCPLCLPAVPPPPVWGDAPPAPPAIAWLPRPAADAPRAAQRALVPPARAPPPL